MVHYLCKMLEGTTIMELPVHSLKVPHRVKQGEGGIISAFPSKEGGRRRVCGNVHVTRLIRTVMFYMCSTISSLYYCMK